MRIVERMYWSSVNSRRHSSYAKELPASVEISFDVLQFLQRQAYSSAEKLGGLLFGYHENNTLRLMMASSIGCSAWYQSDNRAETEVDVRFNLGWSEAINWIFGDRVDWVGNWIISPKGADSNEQIERIFISGVETGLYDDRNILLIAGWNEAEFVIVTRCYLSGSEQYEVPNILVDVIKMPMKIS